MRQKIKLVISDVDGTLVEGGPKGLPSQKVKETLTLLKEKDVKICLATGRSLGEMQLIFNHYPFQGIIVLFGGACIYDITNKTVLWERNIPIETAMEVFKIGQKKGFEVKVFDLNKMHNITKEDKLESIKIKTIVYQKNDKNGFDEIVKFLNKDSNIHAAYVGQWGEDHGIQITHAQATKQYAIYEVLKLLDVKREETIGIGDKDNDIPLLSACGIKVAMGNASESLKQIADYVTSPVWEDGFSKAIEKYVFV